MEAIGKPVPDKAAAEYILQVTSTAAVPSLFATRIVLTLYTLPLDAGLLKSPISDVVVRICVFELALISATLTILGAAI